MDIKKELQKFVSSDIHLLPENSRVGNKIVDYFTLQERLKIKLQDCNSTCFNDFLQNEEKYSKRISTIKYFGYINKTVEWSESSVWKLWNFYYKYYTCLNPIIPLKIINEFSPTVVLDPFACWGSKMLSSYISKSVVKYIGIESNLDLEKPYQNMISYLKKPNFDIVMYFTDILLIDFSKIDYDFVVTKIPNYSKEVHKYSKTLFENEWNDYYEKVFKNIFDNLKSGGTMVLIMTNKVYKSVICRTLGEGIKKRCLSRVNRQNRRIEKLDNYDENMYIWHKPI